MTKKVLKKEPVVKKQPSEKKTAKTSTVIYLGKTIKDVVVHGKVFKNGLPEELKKIVSKKPQISNLIVDISDASKVINSINSQEGLYYDIYKNM